ncbi:MAG TPA: AmmeMemoRadiSam system protein A [Terriglobia bacterium]|nr:AmmeMemoRadiSam system protein A [Terriglobia bacterium]
MLPLTESQQQSLLRLARQAVEASARNRPLSEMVIPSDAPTECCGAFVSLHKGEFLRGCIGHIEVVKPLAQTVRECAFSAAMFDPRFHPVTPEELAELRIEISVLSPFFDITPGQVEVGAHGLFVSQGTLRGLLLPQVAVQWKWDRERFLSETCRKAGLHENAWRHGARIQAFTAQVFAEPGHSARTSPHAA